jgi:hypothetical protein
LFRSECIIRIKFTYAISCLFELIAEQQPVRRQQSRAEQQPKFFKRLQSAVAMATRAVLQAFERYQKERVAFVTAVAEMAKSPQNIEALQQAGAMALLRPLLLDHVPR